MLTKEDLLIQNCIPDISDISLKLYIDFFEEYLDYNIYQYKLNNGMIINLKIDKHRIHHLLGIQHIASSEIKKNEFIENIKNGTVTIDTLRDSKGKKARFNDMKDRILSFSCLNYLLENCTYFYLENGEVPK